MARGKKTSRILKGGIRLVRKHKETGIVTDRRRGRPHPDYEQGYTIDNGPFRLGDPKIKHRKARKSKLARKAIEISLGAEIQEVVEQAVEHRVQSRLAKAGKAAIKAFTKALKA